MYFVYILSNYGKTVFYTGFTNDLARRMHEHKKKLYAGFTAKFNCNILLYYEKYEDMEQAKHRENQIKRYKLEWKRNLIDSIFPKWIDLSSNFPLN